MSDTPLALVAGVGDGLGRSAARRFARAGLRTVLVARNEERLERIAAEIAAEGGEAIARPTDIRSAEEVEALFAEVAGQGELEVVVFNTGAQHRQTFEDIEADMFEKVWRLGCHAGFMVGRAAARQMLERSRGTIIFTGATASVRGGAAFAAFASAKAGLRAVAQSMARSLGPRGIHVCHVVVDGVIDMPATRARAREFASGVPDDGWIDPDAIAETYYALHCQDRSAWSFEVDVRPWNEKF